MCRWNADIGEPLLLDELPFRTEHGLIDQSLHSRMGRDHERGRLRARGRPRSEQWSAPSSQSLFVFQDVSALRRLHPDNLRLQPLSTTADTERSVWREG